MIKDIEYIIKKIIFSETFLLKKRLKRAIKKNYEKELNFINRFKDPNKNAVDVGVYRGVYSYKLSQLYKHVYAFEANPLIFPFLKKNLPKIITNISLFNYALSNEFGVAELKIPTRSKTFFKNNYEELYQLGAASIHEKNNFNKFNSIKVEKNKLDNILNDKNIGFIKIDVEGHEKEVIDGSKRIINENRPTLLVEIEERHSKSKVINTINYINKLGYKSFFVKNNELVETKNLENFNNINNFIFKSQ
jgi:FkbM family methyltransferase